MNAPPQLQALKHRLGRSLLMDETVPDGFWPHVLENADKFAPDRSNVRPPGNYFLPNWWRKSQDDVLKYRIDTV
eukprot:CAMPEP_0176001224 /NCGR_PEP_ID=MMETSP0120_2-20121206/10_1 /TAXON_ID=160619 /ORGANISM="Kryptoperidinium foliaceum, Strain CCMP 1326" /LENGTH=73 /DNA_ID=CAMNT_0017333753 /DNA_START=1086 /DNA_END=1303 /DNA_ORIENTATION=-